ncbi:MAG: MBL fold metallo-hydrolase [Streptosporangiaceae bacterium]|jgi:hypothetical protein
MVVLVRLTVLGACGAWPEPGQACSGFLVEHDGFRLLVDAGYATVPRLLEHVAAGHLDAVFISHGHPDHCADLTPDRRLSIGPFVASICLLPHWVPNAGLRLAAGGTVLAYTGDSGPDPAIIGLARDADLLLAEAERRCSRCSLIVRRLRGLLASNPGDALRAPSGIWHQPILRVPSGVRARAGRRPGDQHPPRSVVHGSSDLHASGPSVERIMPNGIGAKPRSYPRHIVDFLPLRDVYFTACPERVTFGHMFAEHVKSSV